MKKIKITCLDKLLAISSCFVATSCSKSPDSQADNERYVHNSNTASVLVPVETPRTQMYQKGAFEPWDAAATTKPDFSHWDAAFDSYTLSSLSNVDLPLGCEKITVDILLQGLNSCQQAIEGTDDFDSAYSTIIYWDAFIRSFGNFGFPDDTQIILGTAVQEVDKKAYDIAYSPKISGSSNKIFCEELRRRVEGQKDDVAKASVSVTYSEVKLFFDDICFAFLMSKRPEREKGSTLSKLKQDEINALRSVMISQNTASTNRALKKCIKSANENTYKTVLKHNHNAFTVKFCNADITNGCDAIDKKDFGNDVLKNREQLRKQPIVQLISQPKDGEHHNPAWVNNSADIALLNQRFLDTIALIDEYRDEKKGATDDDKKKFLENLEYILVATIHRGIDHNQALLETKELNSLDHFLQQDNPLECLKTELLQVTDYGCKKLQDALKAIFLEAEEVKKQVETPNTVEGKSTKDLSVLHTCINEVNDIINKDWELFTLVQLTYAPLKAYLSNGNFIKNVNQKIIEVLNSNNDPDVAQSYGSVLNSVLLFLSTWNFRDDDNPEWDTSFSKIEIKCDNSPLLFKDGKRNDSLVDFCFNNLQDILYSEYANCVLSKTFQECQELFMLVNDYQKGIKGLFDKLKELRDNATFTENVSFRVLDLFDLCFSDSSNKLYRFYARLPQKDQEFFPSLITEQDASKIIPRIDDIEKTMVSVRGKECPKIENAITSLVNYAVADINNEVIEVINSAGFSESLDYWFERGSLLHNVKSLKKNLTTFIKNFKCAIPDHDKFTPDQIVAAMPQGKDFTRDLLPFENFKSFGVEDYTKFHNEKWSIENNIYYLLKCLKFLGNSIPRKFLKDKAKNLKEAYRNCTNLSLTFYNLTTNMLVACAKEWEMVGFNKDCKLHFENNSTFNQAIVWKPVNEKNFSFNSHSIISSNESFHSEDSPFFTEVDIIDLLSDAWDQSIENFYNVVEHTIPLVCPEGLGFNYPINALGKVIDWKRSDFNNFICGELGQGIPFKIEGRRKTITKLVKPLYPRNRKNDLNQHELLLMTSESDHLTRWGNYEGNSCLYVNEQIAQDGRSSIPLCDVLYCIHNKNNFHFPKYFALTKGNFEKKYSLTTFDNNSETCDNFNLLLDQVKTHINTYNNSFKNFNHELIGERNLESLWNNGKEGKALVSFSLSKDNLLHVFTFDESLGFKSLLKYFIARPSDDVKNLTEILEKNIINTECKENCEILSELIGSDQFLYEIYIDDSEKINNYSEALRFFNVPFLKSSKDIREKWKNMFTTFVKNVHKGWCKGFMDYHADKTVGKIFTDLGYSFSQLNQNMIKTLELIRDNAKHLEFPEYDANGSIKTLSLYRIKIADATAKLIGFQDNLNNDNVASNTYTQIITLIGDLKHVCSNFVNDLRSDHINSWRKVTNIPKDVETLRTKLETTSQDLNFDASIDQNYCDKLRLYCIRKKSVEKNPDPDKKLKGGKSIMEAWGWGKVAYDKAKCDAEVQKIKKAFSGLKDQLEILSNAAQQLDDLTNLTNSRMEMLKYVADNHKDADNTTIGKLISNLDELKIALDNGKNIGSDTNEFYGFFSSQENALKNVIVTSFDGNWKFLENNFVVTGESTMYPGFAKEVEQLYREETLTELLS